MATSLTLQNDPTSPQGYLKVNGTTAATITENGLSMSTLNNVNVDNYTILSDFTGANQSLTASGFQKLPGGLIIQWGYLDDQATTRNFPFTFPSACISLVAGYAVDSYSSSNGPFVFVVSSSQFRLRQGQNVGDANMYWQAIGY
jgi:hypothetical protein